MNSSVQYKKIMFALFLCFFITNANGTTINDDAEYQFNAHEITVTGPKTIQLTVPELPPLFRNVTVMLKDIDTPMEGRDAKCALEQRRAEATIAVLKTLLSYSQHIHISDSEGWDSTGKYMLANLIADGQDVSKSLISMNVARPLVPDAPVNWCAQTLPPISHPHDE